MRAVPFYLLIGRDGAEDDFSEVAVLEFSERDASDNLQGLLHDGERQMRAVVDETRNVILRHLR